MADLAPFRGIRYDPTAVGDLAAVVSPPYDVISERDHDALEAASPYNIVRLILGRDEPGDHERSNRYTRARALVETWLAAGILRRDDAEGLYIYEQRFSFGGEQKVQRGVLGAVRLDEPGGGVLPHERTYDEIVEDRLALLRATATNLDCILCVYDGQDASAHEAVEGATRAEPAARFSTPDGVEHRVWILSEPAGIAAVVRAVAKATVVIADGHHRHQTALRYAAERAESEGPGLWDAQLMFLVDASKWGPALLPIHRTIRGAGADAALAALEPVFRIEDAPAGDPEALADELAKRRIYGRTFAMLDGKRAWWLTVKDRVAEREAMPAERSAAWRDLDVAVLHVLVFEQLIGGVETGFAHSAGEAAERVGAGDADLAFLLAPMPFDAVRAVAEAGEAMPQKSTYFIPKPATGIVLRTMQEG